MKPITLQQVRQVVGGRALTPIPAEAPPICAICTDTRRMESSSLFVAIRGRTHNAHDFLPQAAAGGTIAALVEEPPPQTLPNVHLIQVPDTRAALGKLARFVRQQMLAKVIAVAGSNGKTSTKHLINAALGSKRGSISPKSFNNDIGVPLTLFPADPLQDYIVLEMGTNHHGEIRVLTEMALPDIAVITNIGAEHLEGLDDLMGVRQENASIIAGLNPRGLLVFNGDDADLHEAVRAYPGQKITFGFGPGNDLFAADVECGLDGVRFHLNGSRREVFVPMLGRHTAANALAAIAVGRKMGIREEVILAGLAEATGPEMRLQLQAVEGLTLLNDAYNANPDSMRAALRTLAELSPGRGGRRVAVLGDMRELGPAAQRYHRQLGEWAAGSGLAKLVCVGPQSAWTAESARAAGMAAADVMHCADGSAAAQAVPPMLHRGDLVLLKASRGIRVEQVAEAIVRHRDRPARPVRRAS